MQAHEDAANAVRVRQLATIQFVLDVCADNVVETVLSLKSEITRTPRIETLGPATNDLLDKLVGYPADARGYLAACDAAQRFDLFSDRAGYAGHGKINASAKLLTRQARRMEQKSDRRTRTRMGVPHRFGDRQQRL